MEKKDNYVYIRGRICGEIKYIYDTDIKCVKAEFSVKIDYDEEWMTPIIVPCVIYDEFAATRLMYYGSEEIRVIVEGVIDSDITDAFSDLTDEEIRVVAGHKHISTTQNCYMYSIQRPESRVNEFERALNTGM